MGTTPQPPNPVKAVSSVRSGLLAVLIGINALWGTHATQSLPLVTAGLILGCVALVGGTLTLMLSTHYWVQYIHDYVDYRLAHPGNPMQPSS